MGRTTFEPALANDRWPWPDLDVYVLASHRPAGTPDHVVTDSDPRRLLDTLRAANRGGDVHLVGGPHTIQAYLALGALDRLELVVLPLLFGAGMQLTPSLRPETGLTLDSKRALPGGLDGDRLPGEPECGCLARPRCRLVPGLAAPGPGPGPVPLG